MRKTLAIIGALILFALSVLVVLWVGVNLPEFWTGVALAFVVAGLSVLGWGFGPDINRFANNRKIRAANPRFSHLTVHYSQRTDTPSTIIPARPRFVTYNKKKQAWWVSDLLESHIKRHDIPWHSWDGEKALRGYLRKNRFKVNEFDPSLDDLGLKEDDLR